jgi:hypothetical protein
VSAAGDVPEIMTKLFARFTGLMVISPVVSTLLNVPRWTLTPLPNSATVQWIVKSVKLVSSLRVKRTLSAAVSCPRTCPSPGSVLFPR